MLRAFSLAEVGLVTSWHDEY